MFSNALGNWFSTALSDWFSRKYQEMESLLQKFWQVSSTAEKAGKGGTGRRIGKGLLFRRAKLLVVTGY